MDRQLSDRVSHPVVRSALRLRWDELADLGRIRPNDLRASYYLAGQLSHPRLGLSPPRDPRLLDEPLVGCPSDLRRGLAQQPSPLPALRPPRSAVVGSG